MGLRFRKSINLIPGVRLNIGTTGVSISTGVKGFRKTFHSSGRVTTSVGIPGTGVSYVTSKKMNSSRKKAAPANTSNRRSSGGASKLEGQERKEIFESCDPAVDWEEVLANPTAPEGYDALTWGYLRGKAEAVLAGDAEAMLQVLQDVAPYNDLAKYAGDFCFGMEDLSLLEMEFCLSEERFKAEGAKGRQDAVCGVILRIARDSFALLPVDCVIIHAVLRGETIVSVEFPRESFCDIDFDGQDASELLSQFVHNMDYQPSTGFSPVDRV